MKETLVKVIDPEQFGFIPDSCTTSLSLISMLHNWLGATGGTGSCVRIALLDYKKAFVVVFYRSILINN